MPLHSLSNFEIHKYQNKHKLKGIYSRNNSPKIKDWAYVLNLDEYKSIGTHWITIYVNDDNVTYFGRFLEHIPKDTKKFIGNKNITTNIYRIQAFYRQILNKWRWKNSIALKVQKFLKH